MASVSPTNHGRFVPQWRRERGAAGRGGVRLAVKKARWGGEEVEDRKQSSQRLGTRTGSRQSPP